MSSLPGKDLLKGLQVWQQGDRNQQSSIKHLEPATQAMQAQSASPAAMKHVPIGAGLLSLPKKLVDRIIRNWSIHWYSELSPAKGHMQSQPRRWTHSCYLHWRSFRHQEDDSRPGHLVTITLLLYGSCSGAQAWSDQDVAGIHVNHSKSKLEIQLAIMGGIQSELLPGSNR